MSPVAAAGRIFISARRQRSAASEAGNGGRPSKAARLGGAVDAHAPFVEDEDHAPRLREGEAGDDGRRRASGPRPDRSGRARRRGRGRRRRRRRGRRRSGCRGRARPRRRRGRRRAVQARQRGRGGKRDLGAGAEPGMRRDRLASRAKRPRGGTPRCDAAASTARRSRSASGPPTVRREAGEAVRSSAGPSRARPREPKRRPKPPWRSRKPRWSRAGARTRQLSSPFPRPRNAAPPAGGLAAPAPLGHPFSHHRCSLGNRRSEALRGRDVRWRCPLRSTRGSRRGRRSGVLSPAHAFSRAR